MAAGGRRGQMAADNNPAPAGQGPLVSPHTPNDPNPYVPPPDPPDGTPTPPDPGYAADPALAMMWGMAAPDINGFFQSGSETGNGNNSVPNPHGPIIADMGSFASAEQAMLPITSALVDGYNNLRAQVLNSLNTPGFFGEEAMYSYQELAAAPSDPNVPRTQTAGVKGDDGKIDIVTIVAPDTNIQDMANQFDQVINPSMSRCLRQVADSITAVGHFVNMINLIAQMYCAADKASYFPPPGTV